MWHYVVITLNPMNPTQLTVQGFPVWRGVGPLEYGQVGSSVSSHSSIGGQRSHLCSLPEVDTAASAYEVFLMRVLMPQSLDGRSWW